MFVRVRVSPSVPTQLYRTNLMDTVVRTYEVTYPSGQTVRWKNYTITDCLIKFNGHNSMYDYKLKIREITL